MNNQEAFNKVWEHFVIEGSGPSVDLNGVCRYRGPGGKKCAIGLLVSNEEYHPKFERRGIHTLDCLGMVPPSLSDCNINFLLDLQKAHDHNSSCELSVFSAAIEKGLREIALKYDLEIPNDMVYN